MHCPSVSSLTRWIIAQTRTVEQFHSLSIMSLFVLPTFDQWHLQYHNWFKKVRYSLCFLQEHLFEVMLVTNLWSSLKLFGGKRINVCQIKKRHRRVWLLYHQGQYIGQLKQLYWSSQLIYKNTFLAENNGIYARFETVLLLNGLPSRGRWKVLFAMYKMPHSFTCKSWSQRFKI